MNKQTFDVGEEELKKIRSNDEPGHGFILIIENKAARPFRVQNYAGGLGVLRLTGEWPESLFFNFGHDLATGTYIFDLAEHKDFGLLRYTDPENTSLSKYVSGCLVVMVQNPGFPGVPSICGSIQNARFEQDERILTVNGTFEVKFE